MAASGISELVGGGGLHARARRTLEWERKEGREAMMVVMSGNKCKGQWHLARCQLAIGHCARRRLSTCENEGDTRLR